MKILKTDILIDIVVESKSDLKALTNKLIDNDIIHFVLSEDKVIIGRKYDANNVVNKSTLTNGYIVTVHCKTVDIFTVLSNLNLLPKDESN